MLAYGPVIERLLIVLTATMAVFLGYRLFHLAQEKQGKFVASGKDYKIQLADVGPGIYFALFGSAILVVGLMMPMKTFEIESQGGARSGYRLAEVSGIGPAGARGRGIVPLPGGVQTDFTQIYQRSFSDRDTQRIQTLLQLRDILRDTPAAVKQMWKQDVVSDIKQRLTPIVDDKPFSDLLSNSSTQDDIYILIETYIPYFYLKHGSQISTSG